MVRRANRYFQNLKTKGILSVFKLAKGDCLGLPCTAT